MLANARQPSAPRKNRCKNIWAEVVRRIKSPKHEVKIGVVGKYIELQDAYKSVYESLSHAGIANHSRVKIIRIDAENLETKAGLARLKLLDGILVPGGFGDRGIEGKIAAARYAREKKIPYFGLCLGMQVAVIDYTRNVLRLKQANSVEFDVATPHPVIALMDEQRHVVLKGGTMRLAPMSVSSNREHSRAKLTGKNLFLSVTVIVLK